MAKWEYKRIYRKAIRDVSSFKVTSHTPSVEEINEQYGTTGWELVSVHAYDCVAGGEVWIFKRRIE